MRIGTPLALRGVPMSLLLAACCLLLPASCFLPPPFPSQPPAGTFGFEFTSATGIGMHSAVP
jgi:hypothetical protein